MLYDIGKVMSEMYKFTFDEKINILTKVLNRYLPVKTDPGLCYSCLIIFGHGDSLDWFLSYMRSKAICFDCWYSGSYEEYPPGSFENLYYWPWRNRKVRVQWLEEQIKELNKMKDEQEK